jgi:hypothetical protein
MTFTSTIDKTRKDIEKALGATLGDKPLTVLAGVTDLAAERVRAARVELASRAENFDPKALRDQAQARIVELPAKAEEAVTTVVSNALIAYGDLSERGKTLVDRVRGQQATADLKTQASTTKAKAKATTTTAKKSASSTAKAAAGTKPAAKATKASAKRTAKTAKKGTRDAGSKVGD